jgi:hypothetical protein
MNRTYVTSTNIISAGYDSSSQTLEVEFSNGQVYQYYNISQGVYDAFMTAPSKGKFLAYQIKNAYPYSRV